MFLLINLLENKHNLHNLCFLPHPVDFTELEVQESVYRVSPNSRPLPEVISRNCAWRAGNVGCMLQGFRGGTKYIQLHSLSVVVCVHQNKL